MLKVILLLVYLWQSDPALAPELKVEQKVYPNPTECAIAGGKIAKERAEDPKFVEDILAMCIPARVTEAKS